MFRTDSQLQTDMVGLLKKPDWNTLVTEGPYWANIVTNCNKAAYGFIVRALLANGFLLSQITAWDDGYDFQRRLGMYLCMIEGEIMADFSDTCLKRFDVQDDLKDMIHLAIGGVLQDPLGTAGQVGTGEFADTNTFFDVDYAGDPRSGLPAEF